MPTNTPTATPPPNGASPTWQNWSQNLVYKPPSGGAPYYFTPKTRADLQAVIAAAVANGVTVRVSGQRHSQPPLVADDNRTSVPATPNTYIVDMSCYADLGPGGTERMVLDAPNLKLTVNAGVREDEVDAFLTANNLMMQTVTAGGFFSVGGMTAVDVHGAAVKVPIFAETASAFTIMGPDGAVTTIDASTPAVNGWSPLQFARVSLGGLGVVTSVTLDVLARPYASTLAFGNGTYPIKDQAGFISTFKLLTAHTRLEAFYNPYADNFFSNTFLAFWWDVVTNPATKVPNPTDTVESACALAQENEFGAPYESPLVEIIAEAAAEAAQAATSSFPASAINLTAMLTVQSQVQTAGRNYSDLWLTEAARVVFMSYFIELPGLDDAGLARAWQGLDAVASRVTQSGNFHIAAPMEFRFVQGGTSAMSGCFTATPNTSTFINLDLIGWVPAEVASSYPPAFLQFFADVERDWVALGGFPHNGKMYGFYDPTAAAGTFTAPFNANFLAALRARRGARVQAYNAYRQSRDPNGLFCNDYLKALVGG